MPTHIGTLVSLFLGLALFVQQSYHFIGPALRAIEPVTDEVKARLHPSQPLDFAVYDDDDVEFDPTTLIDGAASSAVYRLEGGSYSAHHAVGRPVETCFTRTAHLATWDRIYVCTGSAISAFYAFIRTVISRIMPTRGSISGAGTWIFPPVTHYSFLSAMMVAVIGMYFESQFSRFVKLRRAAKRSNGLDSDAANELGQYRTWYLTRVMRSIAVGRGAYIMNWAIALLIMSCVGSVRFKPHPTIHDETSLFVRGFQFLGGVFNAAGYLIGWESIREWAIRAGSMLLLGAAWKLARWIESEFGCSLGCCARGLKPVVHAASAAAVPVTDTFEESKYGVPVQPIASAPPKSHRSELAAAPPSLYRHDSIVRYADEDDNEPIRREPREVLMSPHGKMLLRSRSNEMFMGRAAQAAHQEWRLNQERAADDKLRTDGLIGRPV